MGQFSLGDNLARSGKFDVQTHGWRVPLAFQHAGEGVRTVIFIFHGAVDRKTRKVPAYQPFLPGMDQSAHQVSVSDPSMLLDGSFSMSWYAGHDGFPAQTILKDLFAEIIEELGAERAIFMGSSGGGFAALYYSWHVPGSLCLALCPQTRVERYYSGHVKKYIEDCWPDATEGYADVSQRVCLDILDLYAEKFPNTVVYLQSSGDYFHFQNHLLPFLDRANHSVKNGRFLLECGFWGILAHSRSVTPQAFMPWVRTAILAPDLATDTLLETKHGLTGAPQPPVAAPAKSAKGAKDAAKGPDPAKLARAELIGKWQLGQH